jgi:hypothetical protein
MPKKIDKVIVTNIQALKAKYGATGVTKIRAAIKSLIQSDSRRGLETRLVAVDDSTAMKGFAGTAVKSADDSKSNKAAIDKIYRALSPDYVLILGTIDVIPHQDLKNPIYDGPQGDDPDQFAYGDIPYACEAPYSQAPQHFVGPTRVVGRLPDITGADDANYILKLIESAANWKSVDRQSASPHFAITAEIWERSSKLSILNTFGSLLAELKDVPPDMANWSESLLGKPMHFFNCHGAINTPQFFGQPADGRHDFPVALDAAYVDGKLLAGTVAAAECCYGGQLFRPPRGERPGICNVYLGNQAYGFFGSTTIAYGPADGNGQADLICQYFLQSILAGASLGRAALEARQRFVRAASPADPADLKTLAQFNLLGDPSITPVAGSQPAVVSAAPPNMQFLADRVERHDRRRLLFREGTALGSTEPTLSRTRPTRSKWVATPLRARAREHGLEAGKIISYLIRHRTRPPLTPNALIKKEHLPTAYHVLFCKKPPAGVSDPSATKVHPIALVIGKEVNGKVVSIDTVYSR